MMLYDQKYGRILSSNVMTFSSMYSKWFQLKLRLHVGERPYLGGAFTLTQPWWSFRVNAHSALGPRYLRVYCFYCSSDDDTLLFALSREATALVVIRERDTSTKSCVSELSSPSEIPDSFFEVVRVIVTGLRNAAKIIMDVIP
nr:hypothetical protein [Tanacetum cinerariifolium]